MRRKYYLFLVWTIFAIITLVSLFGIFQDLSDPAVNQTLLTVLESVLWGLLPVEFALLAALIVSFRPHNVIGWLMILPATIYVLGLWYESYLAQFPIPPAEPTALLWLAVIVSNISWLLLIFPLLFTMLLFPDGRPPSPRWRWVLVAGLGMCAFLILFGLASPAITLVENSDWAIHNPIGFLPDGTEFPEGPWFAGLIIMTLLCVAAPFVRYRRAAGVEREQIKWLFFACGLFALAYIPSFFIIDESGNHLVEASNGILFVLGIMAVPAAIGIAILRYRLYNIDIIIRKTLLYGALTGLLLLVYFGGVVLFQALFESITGQRSPVAIVISTLIIAALFIPLRNRLQQAIDRRFFRQKYDAQRVLAQFAQTARDEVDLESLTNELAQVTQETVQPESISIWLK